MIFISDTHIGLIPPEKVVKLAQFLSWASQNCQELYIIGDGIDFWTSKPMIEIYTQNQIIFNTVRRISKKIAIKYIIGNHDFLLKQYSIGKEYGIEYCYPEKVIEVDNRKVLLNHGHLYSIERKLLGGTLYKLYLKGSKSDWATIAGKIWYKWGGSKISNGLLKLFSKDANDLKVIEYQRKRTIESMKTNNYDVAITGHTHAPEISKVGDKIYLNCGDWVSHSSYIKYNKDTKLFELKEYSQ